MDNGVYECLVNGLAGNISKSVTVNGKLSFTKSDL